VKNLTELNLVGRSIHLRAPLVICDFSPGGIRRVRAIANRLSRQLIREIRRLLDGSRIAYRDTFDTSQTNKLAEKK